MNEYNRIHISSLLKTLYIKIFSSQYFASLLNLIMTTIISIHTSKINLDSKKWITELVIYIFITFFINVVCIIADGLKSKSEKTYKYYDDAYNIQNNINNTTATNLYRVNKLITKTIKENKIEKGALSQIADFQNLSFTICDELHKFITNSFDCGECEITIFQRFSDKYNKDFVKMIAYKNTKNHFPSSYNREFYLYSNERKKPVFIDIFRDLNAENKILHNKTAVSSEFVYFFDSEKRERQICQYIGIPIKTSRNKIEIVFQKKKDWARIIMT